MSLPRMVELVLLIHLPPILVTMTNEHALDVQRPPTTSSVTRVFLRNRCQKPSRLILHLPLDFLHHSNTNNGTHIPFIFGRNKYNKL